MPWDSSRRVPWKRLLTFEGMYAGLFAAFLVVFERKNNQMAGGLIALGVAVVATTVLISVFWKFGWNPADSPFLSSGHIDAPVATPTPDPTPTPQPQEVAELVTSGKTSKAGTVRTYSLVVGEGRPLANLVFTSPAGSAAKLQIRLRAPSGAIVASKIGRSPVRLSVGLPAGTWTYEVIGKVQTRFTLKVTYPIP